MADDSIQKAGNNPFTAALMDDDDPSSEDVPFRSKAPTRREAMEMVFSNTPLPPEDLVKDFEVRYKTIEEVPVCEFKGLIPITDKYLSDVHQAYIIKENDRFSWIGFFKPGEAEELKKSDKKEDQEAYRKLSKPKDDATLRRILAAKDNFGFTQKVSGMEQKFTGEETSEDQLNLCRSKKGKDGYNLYVFGNNQILENHCAASAEGRLKPLPNETLTEEEVILLVSLGRLSSNQYCIADDHFKKFFVTSHLPTLDRLEEKLLAHPNGVSQERKQAIIADIELAVSREREAVRLAREQVESRKWMYILGGANLLVGGIAAYAIWQNHLLMKQHVKEIDPKLIVKDVTDKAKNSKYTEIKVDRLPKGDPTAEFITEMREVGEQAEFKTALVTGIDDIEGTGNSAGTGKSENIKAYLHTEAKGGNTVVEVSCSDWGKAAAKWAGKPAESVVVVFDYIEQLSRGKPLRVWVKEAHLLRGLGTATGHIHDVLDMALDRLERLPEGTQIILDTNKPQILLTEKETDGRAMVGAEEEAAGRRFTIVTVGRTKFQTAINITHENAERYLGKEITIDRAIAEKIVHLSPLTHKGGLPSRSLGVLNRLGASLRLKEFKGAITAEMVEAKVAAIAKISVEAVRSFENFSRMAIEGFGWDGEKVKQALKKLKGAGYFTQTGEILTPEMAREILEAEKLGRETARETRKGGGGKGTDGEGGPRGSGGTGESGGEPPPATPTGEGKGSARAAGIDPPAPEIEIKDVNRARLERIAQEIVSGMESRARVRGILDGVRGFASGMVPFVAADVLEGNGIITPEQKSLGIGAWFAGMTFAEAATPVHLAAMALPFHYSSEAIRNSLDSTGVKFLKYDRTTNKVSGTLGAGAIVEGAIAGLGYSQGAKTFMEANQVGAKFFNEALMNVHGARFITEATANFTANIKNGTMAGINALRQAPAVVAQVVQKAKEIVPQVAPTLGGVGAMIAGGWASAKAGAVVAGEVILGSAAATATTVVVSGAAVGASIHYSGLGEKIGTDSLGETLADSVFNWLHPEMMERECPMIEEKKEEEPKKEDPKPAMVS